jgi:hypothetical protein
MLVLEVVNICLPEFPLLERDYAGPGTSHIFDMVFDEMSKDSQKEIMQIW